MRDCPVHTLRTVADMIGVSNHCVHSWFNSGILVGEKWTTHGKGSMRHGVNLIEKDWKIDMKRVGKNASEQFKIIMANVPDERRL